MTNSESTLRIQKIYRFSREKNVSRNVGPQVANSAADDNISEGEKLENEGNDFDDGMKFDDLGRK